jgi:hypothetical protein
MARSNSKGDANQDQKKFEEMMVKYEYEKQVHIRKILEEQQVNERN